MTLGFAWRFAEAATLVLVGLVAALAIGCQPAPAERQPMAHVDADAVARGAQIFQDKQCAFCHDTDPLWVAAQGCAACHDQIRQVAQCLADCERALAHMTDRSIDAAEREIVHLREVPHLGGVAQLLRRSWLERYLQRPHDLRPRLEETMPRLSISAAEASDLVSYLMTSVEHPPPNPLWKQRAATHFREPVGAMAAGEVQRGRAAYEALGCGSCHDFSGVTDAVAERGNRGLSRAMLLAPDLRHTRVRFRPDRLVAYLMDPRADRLSAAMPHYRIDLTQARDLAAFIMDAEAAPPTAPPAATFLPLLERSVGYAEVADRVLQRICVHCHGPTTGDVAGDGPGNSGGFGFAARRLDLSSFEGVRAGVMVDGERVSVLRPDANSSDPTPLLVRVLEARHREERAPIGAPLDDLRGMPLGLPALSLRDIQLVRSWVADGAPRYASHGAGIVVAPPR